MTADTKFLAKIAKLMGILFLLYFLISHLLASPAFSADFDYRPDTAFEKKISKRYFGCMPAPLPLLNENYSYRVAEEMFNECLVENANKGQVIKYGVLATGVIVTAVAASAATAGTATGAAAGIAAASAPFVAEYTSGEVVSDGMKCVLKAFVEASSMSSSLKRDSKVAISGAFTLKDWVGLSKSIPEIASGNRLASLKGKFDSLAAIYERTGEARSFGELMIQLSNDGRRMTSQLASGKALTEFRDAEKALDQCKFADAWDSLERASEYAQQECPDYGNQYRLAERQLRTHIFTNRRALSDKRLYNPVPKTPQEDDYIRFHESLTDRKESLDSFSEIFPKIKLLEKKGEEQRRKHSKIERDYWLEVQTVKSSRNSKRACLAMNRIFSIVESQKGQCRESLYSDYGRPVERPDELASLLANAGRERSQDWWNQIDRIRKDHNACNTSAAKTAISKLKSDIAARPVYAISNNQCREVDQSIIKEQLAGFRTPNHCLKKEVPDVTGFTIDKATDAIYEAYLNPGRIKVEKPATADQKPRTIIRTQPKAMSMVKPMTSVDLFIYGARKAEDLVAMPEVIGKTADDAAGLVNGAGLNATVDYKSKADEPEKIPYQVFAASQASGDMLARGSSVVINAYGPRPYVAVPALAGLTREAASGMLAAKKFIMGEPMPGIPAPTDKEPGEIYGSEPPAESLQEIFTTVRPLFYGPHKVALRRVPGVSNMSITTARGVINGSDGFFVFGEATLGKPAPPGKRVGEVYAAIPASNTEQAKGTVIDVLVYGPHETNSGPPAIDIPDPTDNTSVVEPTGPEPNTIEPAPQEPSANRANDRQQEPSVGTDDRGWIGRWLFVAVQNGKPMEFIVNIFPAGDIAVLEFHKRGEKKDENELRFPIKFEGNKLISMPLDFGKKPADRDSSSGSSMGLDKVVGTLAEILKSIKFNIVRDGTKCKLHLSSLDIKVSSNGTKTKKRKNVDMHLTCTRLD